MVDMGQNADVAHTRRVLLKITELFRCHTLASKPARHGCDASFRHSRYRKQERFGGFGLYGYGCCYRGQKPHIRDWLLLLGRSKAIGGCYGIRLKHMGPEDVDEKDSEKEEPRTLVVRAQDGEWIMGEDLILPVTGDETIVEIQEVIKSIKNVPITRMMAFKGEEEDSRISDNHMTWSLSRNGLYAGDMLMIRPTRPNQWLWHPLEWYEERLLKAAEAFASSGPWAEQATGCPLSIMQDQVPVPPPLKRDSLKGILRRFPDRLRLELDLVSEKFVVYPNEEAMLLPSSY